MNYAPAGTFRDTAPAPIELVADSVTAILETVVMIDATNLRECVRLRRNRLGLRPTTDELIDKALWFLEERGMVKSEVRDGAWWYGLVM